MVTKLICVKENNNFGIIFGQSYNLVSTVCGVGFVINNMFSEILVPKNYLMLEEEFLENYI